MAGRLASAGAALTTNGIEAIGGGNDEPSLLCGGWPSIAIWRNPPPFRPVNGAHPLTASSVPGGPLPGLASRTAQFASVWQRPLPPPVSSKYPSRPTSVHSPLGFSNVVAQGTTTGQRPGRRGVTRVPVNHGAA